MTGILRTARLSLHLWAERHRAPFAALHADPDVMADQGGPIERVASDAKFDRYRSAFEAHGVSRWAVEANGVFVGYAGVMARPDPRHPLGAHHEIGWRLVRRVWGQGYATESARTALRHAFEILDVGEILAYTSPDNARSQAVMRRLALRRDASRDFRLVRRAKNPWLGQVWTAERPPRLGRGPCCLN